MKAVGVERTALVGNSLGYEVLVELALVHPQFVDRLVLLGPTPAPKARNLSRQFVGFLAIALVARPGGARRLCRRRDQTARS